MAHARENTTFAEAALVGPRIWRDAPYGINKGRKTNVMKSIGDRR
jgi:hypothetical protein